MPARSAPPSRAGSRTGGARGAPPRARSPSAIPGRDTWTSSRPSSTRSLVRTDGPTALRRGALRALVAPGVDLASLVGHDGDPDRLVTNPRCTLRKFQEQVVVGRVETARGWVWVERYNVYALRVVLAGLVQPSPAMAAFRNAHALAALGVGVPHALAAIDDRRGGWLRRSFFLTADVPGAETIDVAWRRLLPMYDAPAPRQARPRFPAAPRA